ncbi:MAG: cysteine--tRNA ligase [Patescibacteria group bacterium]
MIKLYNSLTRKREIFQFPKDHPVGIYLCGPTVYAPDHLGHARTWIFFDWLRRFLLSKGLQVKFVQNITDVGHLVDDTESGEDKIEKQAKALKKTPQEIARFYEAEHFRDMADLNILKPDVSPRATDHIKDIIDYIKVLIDKGFAYENQGNVYFKVRAFSGYGKLSRRDFSKSKTGARVDKDPLKRDPIDFALWLKADPSHLQHWSSPWGEGYPGWHIECSVMSTKYLGQPFEIHGAASELIFPHHENEIAQSFGFAGKPLARYFLHSGMLLINNQKMSKSLGNFITIKDALRQNDADTIKIAFLSTFWRKPFNWVKKSFSEARKIKEKLLRAKSNAQSGQAIIKSKIEKILDNDFNTPKALTLILNNLSKLSKEDFQYLEEIFGLILIITNKLSEEQKKMINQREELRKRGDFKQADIIREKLEKEGIIIEDTKKGPQVLTF